MNKRFEFIKALIILPGSALVFIPGGILYWTRSFSFLGGLDFPLAWAFLVTGVLFIALGLFVAVKTAALFLTVGDGTPAPWAPPRNFVVSGPYRYVRNPMLLSVLSMILGEAVLCGSWPLFYWFVIFWIINTFYFIWFEEQGLINRFGESYLEYKKNVPRWLPRRSPWNPVIKT
jgi:protein-S-isoprenylcysteine O-methyltransferase Ste14